MTTPAQSADDLLPPEETDCAGCRLPVENEQPHMKWVAGYGRRSGRFHPACTPPDLEAWLMLEDERLLATPKRSASR
jgi:hypothetical protein